MISFQKHKEYLARVLHEQKTLHSSVERDLKLLPQSAIDALVSSSKFARAENLHTQGSSILEQRLASLSNAEVADSDRAAVEAYRSSLTKLINSRKREEAIIAGIEKYHPSEEFNAWKFCTEGYKEFIKQTLTSTPNVTSTYNAETTSWLTRTLGKNAGWKAAGIGITLAGGGWVIHELSKRNDSKTSSAAQNL